MKPTRVLLLVLGSLIALVGFGLAGAGASIGWATGTQRDADGFFTTSSERYESAGYAVTSDRIDLGEPGPEDWWADRDLATVRIVANSAGDDDVFVGIGPEADVEAYLAGVPHDEVTSVEFRPFSADYRRENVDGTSTPAPPDLQAFWVAQASGAGNQTLTWDLEPGDWAIVVMNADATANVSADVELAGKVDYLVPLAIGLGVGGLVLLACGAALIFGGVVGSQRSAEMIVAGPTSTDLPMVHELSTVTYPLRLDGHLDAHLSRWMWLVKWLLAVPHAIVLVVLWIAFIVLTVVAFVAILFTGRYPRSIFDFNVGVLRWTWRVSYYATSVLGTDRYPPFTLAATDYPARLDVEYPQRLSRGLVLVKSWLLAIPHLLIVGVLTASWTIGGDNDGARFVFGGGLLGILVVIAAITLAVTGQYPAGLHSLIMGVNRWIYRVIAYVALMTDDYPPFHLDQGGPDPAGRLAGAPFDSGPVDSGPLDSPTYQTEES